jgi:succinate dehydrogenase / fumarate reductase, cytochrome b subunit
VPSKPTGTLYRGKTGMWSWVLHRITGVAIFFFLLVHTLNGVRIILIDFWSKGAKYQRVMFWIVIALAVILFAAFAPRHIEHVLEYMQAGK